jgi:hypothetical protein
LFTHDNNLQMTMKGKSITIFTSDYITADITIQEKKQLIMIEEPAFSCILKVHVSYSARFLRFVQIRETLPAPPPVLVYTRGRPKRIYG